MAGIPHPYLTDHLPGVGGRLKTVIEDFVVEEIPLYTPCGEGEHTYFLLEKRDVSTPAALERLARELRLPVRQFGYAGLKDRKGVTRQWVSVAEVAPEGVRQIRLPQLEILEARRHTNKLRVGHLQGNRFEIRVREVDRCPEARIEGVLDVLRARGIPNYYGPQRFGNRGYAHQIGRDLLKQRHREAVETILGHPAAAENNPHVVEGRKLFSAGSLPAALEAYPLSYYEERRLLKHLIAHEGDYAGAAACLRRSSRKLYLSAYQSYLFNLTLSERLLLTSGEPGRMLPGDLAFLHRNGAVFAVDDVLEAQARADRFEVSPSGPIFGQQMPWPQGEAADLERRLLEREDVSAEDLSRLLRELKMEGGRRSLRVPVADLDWHLEGGDLEGGDLEGGDLEGGDLEGGDLLLKFFLPKGSYATTLLREIMKNDTPPEGFYTGDETQKHGLWSPDPDSPLKLS